MKRSKPTLLQEPPCLDGSRPKLKPRLGPPKGSKAHSYPMAQQILEVLFALHRDDYLSSAFGEDFVDTTKFGCFCALLRHRAYCELIHQDEPKKAQGKRRKRSMADRGKGSTSYRLDFFVLPEEWGVLRYCMPDADNYIPCAVRICFGVPKRQALGAMGWLPDDSDTAWPDNENNEAFELAILETLDKADRLLQKGPMTAMAAYKEASKSGFAGIMTLSVAPALSPPAIDEGKVYFSPDYRRESCKIGTSKNPPARMKSAATQRTGTPIIMAILRGGRFTERMIHRKLAKYHIEREHFQLGPTFQFIMNMAIRNAPLHSLLES